MSESIPVGSRVVLVEDHRSDRTFGIKGWRGIVEDDNPNWESFRMCGRYGVRFDHGPIWNVNASAVALETDPALTAWERDTALAMALRLARLIEVEGRSVLCAYWLRDCAAQELEGE